MGVTPVSDWAEAFGDLSLRERRALRASAIHRHRAQLQQRPQRRRETLRAAGFRPAAEQPPEEVLGRGRRGTTTTAAAATSKAPRGALPDAGEESTFAVTSQRMMPWWWAGGCATALSVLYVLMQAFGPPRLAPGEYVEQSIGDRPPVVVCLGDSNMHELRVPWLGHGLRRFGPSRDTCRFITGVSTAIPLGVLQRALQDDLLRLSPDAVVVLAGTNDAIGTFERLASTMYSLLGLGAAEGCSLGLFSGFSARNS